MSSPKAGESSHSRAWSVEEPTTPITRTKSKTRDPPPALFLHPSPAASHVSLPGIMAPGAHVPGPSGLSRTPSHAESNRHLQAGPGYPAPDSYRPKFLKQRDSTRSADRTDALWAEMQATLEEVELSASGGTRVFSPEHEQKLGDLRTAQIALAQAWARSEAEDYGEPSATPAALEELRNMQNGQLDAARSLEGDATDGGKTTIAGTSLPPGSSAGGFDQLGAQLEEETESDILLARRRREANDLYFQRVNEGVIDVVTKLEDVARAMRAVEQESKDLWNENESVSGSLRV